MSLSTCNKSICLPSLLMGTSNLYASDGEYFSFFLKQNHFPTSRECIYLSKSPRMQDSCFQMQDRDLLYAYKTAACSVVQLFVCPTFSVAVTVAD